MYVLYAWASDNGMELNVGLKCNEENGEVCYGSVGQCNANKRNEIGNVV